MEKKFNGGGYSSIVSHRSHVSLREVERKCKEKKQIHAFSRSDGLRSKASLALPVRSCLQKDFHADVTSMMRKWLKEEELLPEDQRPTTQAQALYVKVSRLPLPSGSSPTGSDYF